MVPSDKFDYLRKQYFVYVKELNANIASSIFDIFAEKRCRYPEERFI